MCIDKLYDKIIRNSREAEKRYLSIVTPKATAEKFKESPMTDEAFKEQLVRVLRNNVLNTDIRITGDMFIGEKEGSGLFLRTLSDETLLNECKARGLDVKYSEETELAYRLNWVMQDYCKAGKDEKEQEHRTKCYKLFWDALEDSMFFEQKEQNQSCDNLDDEIHRFSEECIDVHEAKLYGNISERVIPVDCYELTARHFAKWGERQKEQKPAEFAQNQFDGIIYGMGGHSTDNPAEWRDEFTQNIRNLITNKLTVHTKGLDGSELSSTVFIDDKTAKDIASGVLFYAGKAATKNPNIEIPEWSEEDEFIKNGLIRGLKAKRDIFGYQTFSNDNVNITRAIEWLKSLPERFNLQPKQGWNEEDSRIWNNIWDVLDGPFQLSEEGYKEAAQWFKTHCPYGRAAHQPCQVELSEEDDYPEKLENAIKKLYYRVYNDSKDESKWMSYLKFEEAVKTIVNDYGKQKPAEWSEDWREEDIQTRFAFYTYKDVPRVLYLSNVFVEEASRNHGFGTRILKAVEKVAEAIDAITIRLKVKQDSPANAWYRKHGYSYLTFEDGYDWLEKNLEYLKPAKQEWSEEDELMRTVVIQTLETLGGRGTTGMQIDWLKSLSERLNLQPKQELSKKDKRLLDFWLDVINRNDWRMDVQFCKASKEFINRLKSLCPQPPVEWSKEDEKIWQSLLRDYEYAMQSSGTVWSKNFEKKYNWLKSLRPSWKPSEEQMGALNYAYCELFKREDVGHNILGPLQNLIDTLSKL